MTSLFVILPLVTLVLGWIRPSWGGLYCGNMLFLAGLAGLNLCQTLPGSPRGVTFWANFLVVGPHRVDLGVYLDFYSSYMVWVVFTVSALVHLYSTVYMGGDPRLPLFLGYLTLFTFFMVTLLVAPNYVQLFMGWEGVGLTSYLLVNFWHTRVPANKSGLKALLVNRVGDFFFLYVLFGLAHNGGTLSFLDLGVTPPVGVPFFVVAAAAAKSAQLGLHTWLPDAMEGPTPVSALIHAATMVTAGIFLLFRSPHLVGDLRGGILLLGSTTALFAGTVATFQYDLKRVIAYSTCSQLGFMVVAFSLDAPELSLYHLANHAFFKALLFLLAGLVIHALADEQDMRRMGGLLRILPVTYVLFVLGSFALAGFPFLSGWYSKDAVLEVLGGKLHYYAWGACLGAAYLTAYYSFRTVWLVFLGRPRGPRSTYLASAEADPLSLGVVVLLGGFSLFHGFLLRETFLGWGRSEGWSTPLVEAEFGVTLGAKLLPLGLSLAAGFVCWRVESQGLVPSRGLVLFFSKRWWWDLLDSALARRFLFKGYAVYLALERGFFEWLGPTGLTYLLGRGYDLIRTRGWLPGLWLSGLTGFTFLALLVLFSSVEQTFPYVPFVAFAVDRPGRAD